MKLIHLNLTLVLSIFLTACSQETADPNSPVATSIQTAIASARVKSEGRWQLVSVLSGWTGKASLPVQTTELVIDNQLRAIYYEDGKEVSRYQYVLTGSPSSTGSPSGIRYSVINQVGKPTLSFQREGNFRVKDQQLIVGDTGNDGNDYTFRRL